MSHPDRLSCEEVFRRLDAYLDRVLEPDELAAVEAHLETCAECAGEYRFEEKVLTTVRNKLRRIQAPPELVARLAACLGEAGEKKS